MEGKIKKKRRVPTHFLWILGTFFILLIGISLIMVILGLNHQYFKVDNYEIKGNVTMTEDQVIEALNIPENISIFTVDLDMVKDQVAKLGAVESVVVKKVMPDTLLIDITEDAYLGYIQVDNGYLLVGANLTVESHVDFLSDEDKEGLIKISNAGYDVLYIGSPVSVLERECEFLDDLTNHVLRTITTEVDFGVENEKATIYLKPGTRVDFGVLSETDYKIALIEKVVSDLQGKGIKAKEIILDGTPNPIVVTE